MGSKTENTTQAPETFKTLVLSTVHLYHAHAAELEENPLTWRGLFHDSTHYGWSLGWDPSHLDEHLCALRKEADSLYLVEAVQFAVRHGCRRILFDQGGMTQPDLPTFPESWDLGGCREEVKA
jgi:hypothetical protein